jgi:hypothetical protein
MSVSVKTSTSSAHHSPEGLQLPSAPLPLDDSTVLKAFNDLSGHRKRTPLLNEVCSLLEKRAHVVVPELVATSLRKQGLPCITPRTLKTEYDTARKAAGLGLSDRLTASQFSAHLKEQCGVTLGRQFLARWERWADQESKPVFKRRAKGLETQTYLKSLTEREYAAAVATLRESGIHSRAPRVSELYLRVKNRSGEFGFGPSGFKRILSWVNQSRITAGEQPLTLHSCPARSAFNDKVERAHWAFLSKEGRSPTYHELAAEFSKKNGKPVHWEVIRSAYRRINGAKLPDAPTLKPQITRSLYDIDIIRAHATLNSEMRAPTMRDLYEEIQRNRPGAPFSIELLRNRVEALRSRNVQLPTRHHEITTDMVKDAYTRTMKILEGPPSLDEVRSVLLHRHPEVSEISRDAIGVHIKRLRLPGTASVHKAQRSKVALPSSLYPLDRSYLLNRVDVIRRLSLPVANAFVPRVTQLMDRFSRTEEQPRVFYIPRSSQSKRLVKLIARSPSDSQEPLTSHQLPEGARAFLKARKLLDGQGTRALKTSTPAMERLLKEPVGRDALSASEWRSLISFSLHTLLPQVGVTSRRVLEVQDSIPGRYLSTHGDGRDIRLLLNACLKFHLRTAPHDGGVSHFELLDLALREGLRGSWRLL